MAGQRSGERMEKTGARMPGGGKSAVRAELHIDHLFRAEFLKIGRRVFLVTSSKHRKALIAIAAFALLTTAAVARTFGGYECTVDCSGHKAGYEWAEAKGIQDELECDEILDTAPNRTSFYEGCMAYVEDPSRGADKDDDGDDIDEF